MKSEEIMIRTHGLCVRVASTSCAIVGAFFLPVLFLAVQSVEAQTDQSETANEANSDATEVVAMIDSSGDDWKLLGPSDFANVNCKEDTWQWKDDTLVCNGNCLGGFRTNSEYRNFEMVIEWKHLTKAGNSGLFVWAPKDVLDSLKPGALPQGIEIQILDHGYAEQYEKSQGKKSDWFTTHGDVFPCGVATMKPFEPAAPNGKRSFPNAEHSKGFGEWNHYYIRAINGEVRLWVNGHEVAGGNECKPDSGFICLEAEGAPIEFRNIKVRVLP